MEETGNTCSMLTLSRESEGTPNKLSVKADERKEYNLKVMVKMMRVNLTIVIP